MFNDFDTDRFSSTEGRKSGWQQVHDTDAPQALEVKKNNTSGTKTLWLLAIVVMLFFIFWFGIPAVAVYFRTH